MKEYVEALQAENIEVKDKVKRLQENIVTSISKQSGSFDSGKNLNLPEDEASLRSEVSDKAEYKKSIKAIGHGSRRREEAKRTVDQEVQVTLLQPVLEEQQKDKELVKQASTDSTTKNDVFAEFILEELRKEIHFLKMDIYDREKKMKKSTVDFESMAKENAKLSQELEGLINRTQAQALNVSKEFKVKEEQLLKRIESMNLELETLREESRHRRSVEEFEEKENKLVKTIEDMNMEMEALKRASLEEVASVKEFEANEKKLMERIADMRSEMEILKEATLNQRSSEVENDVEKLKMEMQNLRRQLNQSVEANRTLETYISFLKSSYKKMFASEDSEFGNGET